MNILFSGAIEFLFLFLITCLQTFFYSRVLGLSQNWRGVRLALAVLFIAIFETALQLAAMNIALWLSLLFLGVVILYPVFFMSGSFRERLFFGIVNLVIIMISILLTNNILFPEGLVQSASEISWRTLLPCALLFIIYGVLALAIAHLKTEGRRYISRQHWTGLIVGFSGIFLGLSVIQYFNRMENSRMIRVYLTIFSIGLLVIWLLSYFIFYFICRYYSKIIETNTLLIQNEMIERYMLRKQAADERIKVLSHDLKHSLIQWRLLAEEKGKGDALQDISEYEEQLSSSLLINVENETANAIINQKKWEANQTKVTFQTDGVFHDDLLISKLDLCSLLGNLLDNALEAAMQAETATLRQVKLVIRRKGNLLILVIENGYAIAPILEKGYFVTHKKDKNSHSIGMRSIANVVEKYDGVLKYSYGDHWFKSTIMLRGYKTVLSNEN